MSGWTEEPPMRSDGFAPEEYRIAWKPKGPGRTGWGDDYRQQDREERIGWFTRL